MTDQEQAPGQLPPGRASSPGRRAGGFTLLELAVVVAILAGVAGMSVAMGYSMIQSAHRAQTNRKLNTIIEAIESYRLLYNRLPCPANAALAETDPNFGVEAANPGSCTGGSPAATYSADHSKNANIPSPTKVVEGALPFQVLKLPKEFMVDAWGRRFGYAVWTPDTAIDAFLTYGIAENCGGITVKNAGGGYRSTASAYAVIAYGEDGHGAYTAAGMRHNAGSTNADEKTNAHFDQNGLETQYTANYVMKERTEDPNDSHNVFDDQVVYRERFQMINRYDAYVTSGAPCSPGFRVDGTIANGNLGANLSGSEGASIALADVNNDGIPDLIITGYDPGSGKYHAYVVFGQSNSGSFANPFLLSSLNGSNGFDLTNLGGSSSGGLSIKVADMNGDGIQDLVLYPITAGTTGYIVFGQSGGSWPSSPTSVATLNDTTSPKVATFQISANGFSYYGLSLGDINGDGINDIVIGNSNEGGENSGKGQVIAYFGHAYNGAHSWGAGETIADLTGGTESSGGKGFVVNGPVANNNTTGVALGDFNGDGIQDILVGRGTLIDPGYVLVIWGHNSSYNWSGTIDSSPTNSATWPADGSVGVTLVCAKADCSAYWGDGLTATAAGDVNGDGVDDAIIATASDGTYVHVLLGHAPGANAPVPSTWWNGSGTPITLTGGLFGNASMGTELTIAYGSRGARRPMAGDITGDGKKDLILGGEDGGALICPKVIFNNAFTGGTTWAAANINGNNGFKMAINEQPSKNKNSLMVVSDANADSINDLILGNGAITANGQSNAGSTWIVWGKSSGYPNSGSFDDSATYQGTTWIRLDGDYANEYSGWSVATGDLNHDGKADIAIAAPGNSPNGVSGAGSVYVIWGNTRWSTLLPSGAATLETLVGR